MSPLHNYDAFILTLSEQIFLFIILGNKICFERKALKMLKEQISLYPCTRSIIAVLSSVIPAVNPVFCSLRRNEQFLSGCFSLMF